MNEEIKRRMVTPDYNFEMECQYDKFKKEKDALKRFLIYKSTGEDISPYHKAIKFCLANQEAYPELEDCDKSELARQVYEQLWGWKKETFSTEGAVKLSDALAFNEAFAGDTMNSVQTILNNILRTFVTTEDKIGTKYKEYKHGRYYSLLFFLELYEEFHGNTEYDIIETVRGKYGNVLWPYIEAYHTLGNFVLVPVNQSLPSNKNKKTSFNPYRGLKFGDFWDLSLHHLRETEGQGEWLSAGEFHKYVNYFFLWDYVIIKDNEYQVKALRKVRFMYDNADIVKKEQSFDLEPDETRQFLNNAMWAIKRRGIFMTAMLQLQADIGPEMYDRLRVEIFSSTSCYHGFDAVLKEILRWLKRNGKDLQEYVRKFLKEEPEFKEVIEKFEEKP